MSDQLKQFIQDNRAAFDNEEPGANVYKRIEQEISGQKKMSWRPGLMRWAAVVTGLIILSGIYFILPKKNSANTASPVVEEKRSSRDIEFIGDPVYAKQITHFQEVIGLQQAELRQLKTDYPELYSQFVKDINELDSSYQALKTNLPENPNREMLLEAMIQNLQLQSELLNKQLLIIKEIRQKTKSHEQTNI